ncbi:hypothetical protein F0562_009422 [Nyssa sinensis]|uniref:Auxin-responsive protein n=1 Tax=Nyssa sinensis TaxID=561372 RepID=A0A5J4ZY78_9ASTE|nr:hypothetical protein F0562_009422 [Nyssa sinensis]
MELQLGLALPSNPIKGFDLNSYVYEPKEVLSSDSLNHLGSCFFTKTSAMKYNKNKRCFDEAFGHNIDVIQTLPLLFCKNQPNEEDDSKELDNNSFITNKSATEVVGWPPINSWRKKLCYQNHGGGAANNRVVDNGCGGGRRSRYMYVKVTMEGVAIGRKVDLSQHHSYQTLQETVIGMFGKCEYSCVRNYECPFFKSQNKVQCDLGLTCSDVIGGLFGHRSGKCEGLQTHLSRQGRGIGCLLEMYLGGMYTYYYFKLLSSL